MVSPTLPGCPHHVSYDETSMLIRAFLAFYSPETGYSPMTAQPYHIISSTDNFILARFLFLIETRFH
jgi:hypothetical protein